MLVVLTLVTLLYQSVPSQQSSTEARAARCGNKIAYLTGAGDVEQPSLASARLAVDQYNAAHPDCIVTLAEYNTRNPDADSDDRTTQATDNIVGDRRVLGVIGPVTADEANIALPALERAGVVTISPMLHDTISGGEGFRVFHRVVGNTNDDTAASIRWLTQTLKATKIFVLDDDFEETTANAKEARRLLGTAAAGSASVDDVDADQTEMLAKMVASGATAIYYSGHLEGFEALAPKIRAAKPSITIVGAHWVVEAIDAGFPGKAAASIYATNPNTLPSQAGSSFPEQFLSRYKMTAGYYGPEGYDAANIMLSGLAAGKVTRADLLTWVHNYKGQGVTGAIAFKPNGDRANPTVVLLRVSNGLFYAQQVIAGGGSQAPRSSAPSAAPA